MVKYSANGSVIFNAVATGKNRLMISGDIAKYADEISLVLTRLFALSDDTLYPTNNTIYFGASQAPTIEVAAENLVSTFGISLICDEIAEEHIITRDNGLFYAIDLCEVVSYNEVKNVYITNDGIAIAPSKISNKRIHLRKASMNKYMPDLVLAIAEADKSWQKQLKYYKLDGFDIGTTVRIKTWDTLIATHAVSYATIDEQGDLLFVDAPVANDDVAVIQDLGYAKVSADYYGGKLAIVKDMDKLSGVVTLIIDDVDKHYKFIDIDGTTQESYGIDTKFTLAMVESV
jgi:hypothetical protein